MLDGRSERGNTGSIGVGAAAEAHTAQDQFGRARSNDWAGKIGSPGRAVSPPSGPVR